MTLVKYLLIFVLCALSMSSTALVASDSPMKIRDYLLPRYKSKYVTYYSYNEKQDNYYTHRSKVKNIRKIALEKGDLFVFQFTNGDEAVIPFKATKLWNKKVRDDSKKITPGFLMSAKSYSENTSIIFGKEGQGSSMLADLEKNADKYNEKNNFTSMESIIYTDSVGNTNSAQVILAVDGITLLDGSVVTMGDIVKYDLTNLEIEDNNEEKE